MMNAIIVIVIAIFLFILLWKLMKNVLKALIIVTVLLLIFSGIIFVRDFMILRNISSDDTLIVLEREDEPILGVMNDEIIREDFKRPYVVLNLDKVDNADEILELLEFDETKLQGIELVREISLNNLMANLDKGIVTFRPEPYFMSVLKGTFRDRVKEDANLVGDAIRSNIRNLTN